MRVKTPSFRYLPVAAAVCVSLLTACGGGGGGPQPLPEGSISGVAFDGPVAGGTVRAYALNSDGSRGVLVAESAATSEDGRFRIDLQTSNSPLLLELRGGTYTALVGDNPVPVTLDDSAESEEILSAIVNYTPGQDIPRQLVTPVTTLSTCLTQYKISQNQALNAAKTAADNTFNAMVGGGVNIHTTIPTNLTSPGSNSPNSLTPELRYAFALEGISGLVSELVDLEDEDLDAVLGEGIYTGVNFTRLACEDVKADGLLNGIDNAGPVRLGGQTLNENTYRIAWSDGILGASASPRNQSRLDNNDLVLRQFAVDIRTQAPGDLFETEAPPSADGSIKGSVAVNGPLSGATVIAYYMNDEGVAGDQVPGATTTTDIEGNFEIEGISEFDVNMLLRVSGGSYTDVFSDEVVSFPVGGSDELFASILYDEGVEEQVQNISPVTSMAHCLANYHLTKEDSPLHVAAAKALSDETLGAFIAGDTINPIDITSTPARELNSAADAFNDELKYGFALAGFSGLIQQVVFDAQNRGIPAEMGVGIYQPLAFSQFVCQDLRSDGKLDGIASGQPLIAGTSGFRMTENTYRQDWGIGVLMAAQDADNQTGFTAGDAEIEELVENIYESSDISEDGLFITEQEQQFNTNAPVIEAITESDNPLAVPATIQFRVLGTLPLSDVSIFKIVPSGDNILLTSLDNQAAGKIVEVEITSDVLGDSSFLTIGVEAEDVLGQEAQTRTFEFEFTNTKNTTVTLKQDSKNRLVKDLSDEVPSDFFTLQGQVIDQGFGISELLVTVGDVNYEVFANELDVDGNWSLDIPLELGVNDVTVSLVDVTGYTIEEYTSITRVASDSVVW